MHILDSIEISVLLIEAKVKVGLSIWEIRSIKFNSVGLHILNLLFGFKEGRKEIRMLIKPKNDYLTSTHITYQMEIPKNKILSSLY